MIDTGLGRGFIGVQDNASKADFDRKMSGSRVMYSPEHALEATKNGILSCLKKKNKSKYENVHFLLIKADLSTLPKERWSAIRDELVSDAAELPFKEVHVIGNTDEEPWGFQIK